MIWYDNLSLDSKNEIPCYENNYFKFDYFWEYSITIKFDPDIVDIKKLVSHNKLSPEFIENNIRPLIENDFDDDPDGLTMHDIYKIQKNNFNKK